jgi:hypothetical protein
MPASNSPIMTTIIFPESLLIVSHSFVRDIIADILDPAIFQKNYKSMFFIFHLSFCLSSHDFSLQISINQYENPCFTLKFEALKFEYGLVALDVYFVTEAIPKRIMCYNREPIPKPG